jgi:tetratricopeptide (TPR) repeat protein
MELKGVRKLHVVSLIAICVMVLTVVDSTCHLPALSAPIEGNVSMAELTPDDRKPIQLSSRQDINHEGREAFIRAFQAQKSGLWSYAITNYQKAIDSNPDMNEAFWNLGLCLEQDSKFDKAKEAFLTALKIDWSNALIYKHLAYLSFKMGNAEEGREYLKKYLHR